MENDQNDVEMNDVENDMDDSDVQFEVGFSQQSHIRNADLSARSTLMKNVLAQSVGHTGSLSLCPSERFFAKLYQRKGGSSKKQRCRKT